MLRRSTSRSGSSLSHSKSTTSVRSAVQDLEHISPADAIRDAHVAATVSFTRARDRTRASIMSHPRYSFDGHVPDTVARPRAELHHRRSVRFVKPVIGSRNSVSSQPSNARGYPETYLPLNDLHGSENQRLSHASSLCYGPGVHGREDAYSRALQATDDYCTPEDNIGSAPSSYRRLRKSKSMFTPSASSKADIRSDCRFSSHQGFRAHTLRPAISDDKENQRPSPYQLRAPKSMSFLKSRPDIPVRKFVRQENDAAVEMARDMFKKTAQQQERLKSYPSRFFRSKRRSGLSSESNASMRSSSNTTVPLSLSSSSLSISKSTVSAKVRKVSNNLKSRLKRFLHINNKGSGESPLSGSTDPARRNSTSLEAPGDRVSDNHVLPFDGGIQGPTAYAINSVSSRLPSFREVPGSLKSRQCSWESLQSDQRSTVDGYSGNWANPGLDMAPIAASLDWEHHRLSVIKEHGNHLLSPGRGNAAPFPAGPPYSDINNHAASSMVLASAGPVVSGERIYSALMRHQREKTVYTMEDSAAATDFLTTNPQDASEPPNRSPLTIRCVKPEDDVFVNGFRTSAQTGSLNSTLRGSRTSSTGSIIRKPLPSSSHLSAPGQGPSPHNHLFRTGSPYRRSLQEAIRAVDYTAPDTPGASYMLSMPEINLPPRCPSAPESVADNGLDYTSSVYSSATASPQDSLVDSTGRRAPRPYSAFVGAASLAYEANHQPTLLPNMMTSDASPVEWKSGLFSKVERIEDPVLGGASPATLGTNGLASSRPPGHVRQGAEIESSDAGSPSCSLDQNTAQNSPQFPCPSGDASTKSASKKNPDPNENEPPGAEGPEEIHESVQKPSSPPPPIPTKSGLRSAPSLPCIRTPSNRIKGRLPKSTPRPSSFLDSASQGLKRRSGIRLARKARAGLKHNTTLSCTGDGTGRDRATV